jgi:hypothetical protein
VIDGLFQGVDVLEIKDPTPFRIGRYETAEDGSQNKGDCKSTANHGADETRFVYRAVLGEGDLRETVQA